MGGVMAERGLSRSRDKTIVHASTRYFCHDKGKNNKAIPKDCPTELLENPSRLSSVSTQGETAWFGGRLFVAGWYIL